MENIKNKGLIMRQEIVQAYENMQQNKEKLTMRLNKIEKEF